jgi:hypothetical protein
MNSLLSNLGPRYSRRNSTTPIVLGFLLLIIAIAVATYFIKRDDDDDDGKDKKDENEGETVPSIEEPKVTRTLNPDPSNSSESGTTETYEIGGGITETYQIEYNEGWTVSQPVAVTDTLSQNDLSKNVTIGITWGNKSGFGNTFKLEIEHWMKEFNDSGKGFEKKGDSVIKTKYKHGKAYDTSSEEDIETEDAKYFKNFETGLKHEFTGDGSYSFVGIHAIKIKAKYVAKISTNPTNTDIVLFDGTLEANQIQWVEVKATDLTATLKLTKPETRDYEPIQGSFTMGAVDIKNTAYYVTSSTGVDINTITGSNGSVPVYLVPFLGSSAKKFYFRFKGDDKYLTLSDDPPFSKTDTIDDALLITFISSTRGDDDDDNTKWLRLMVGDKYIVISDGKATLKKLSDIDSQDVYDTLDWKFTDSESSESSVECDQPAARQCITDLMEATGSQYFNATVDTVEGVACYTKFNCAPDI